MAGNTIDRAIDKLRSMLRSNIEKLETEAEKIQEEIKAHAARLAALGGSTRGRKKMVKAARRRVRRSSAEVLDQANKMVAFIKSRGSAGISGKEITRKFGKVLPSIRAFVESRLPVKLKTSGKASSTRYTVG